ncbi:protein JTB-like isoform X1 [Scleropages formosus]|uniref:Protein JTB n=1 Tax=Scleropages formosus TaxID=113540 RepID=A0A8C9VL74_SCLFO|nr:protein JTB-like isoform X1 [Scleropages formosus]
MESDCRISVKSVVFYMLLWSWLCLRVYCAPGLSKASTSMMEAMATPCWQVEEFVVSAECFQCNTFQQKLWRECSSTGYVEKINCTKSNKDEYKSCRSIQMEEHLFWKFEGTMMALTLLFAFLVVLRQRALDRLASEKVRKQIESL